MKEDYKAAKKLGEKAVREAVRNGASPYLPVLDSIEEVKNAAGQRHLGLLDLPISRIKGNKEAGRNSAFANNFMPLLGEDTEFGIKWSNLYDSFKQEGIRDAIKVYEYMNQYYVQEGNKRVSVTKFGKVDFILADVTRIIPQKNDSDEVKAYYEYLDFYKCTKNFLIVFSVPGEYKKLAELLDQNLEEKWPEDLCLDLKSAFFKFSRCMKTELKIEDEFVVSDAFLMYISIFSFKTLCHDSNDQIIKNIRLARDELMTSNDNVYLTEAPEATEEKQTGIMSMFSRAKKYTDASPLKVGFIYDAGIEDSRWIDSHEAGRLYVEEMTHGNVVTKEYYANNVGGVRAALDMAIDAKNEIIFAVSPDMVSDVLKVAVHHPDIKFLTCSRAQNYSSLRCYQGKLYEASFLMGVLSANLLLTEGNGSRKIGYVFRNSYDMSVIDLNAFAIGVSVIDPECRISLKCPEDGSSDYRKEWEEEGVTLFADFEYSTGTGTDNRPGVYWIKDGKDVYIGAPYFNWGKYYVKIVQSVLAGTWNINELIDRRTAANYWYGLSTGVVDVRAPKIPYQTQKLLSFFKDSLINGNYDPFDGEIRAQGGKVIQKGDVTEVSEGEILKIRWLNENIDGELPDIK